MACYQKNACNSINACNRVNADHPCYSTFQEQWRESFPINVPTIYEYKRNQYLNVEPQRVCMENYCKIRDASPCSSRLKQPKCSHQSSCTARENFNFGSPSQCSCDGNCETPYQCRNNNYMSFENVIDNTNKYVVKECNYTPASLWCPYVWYGKTNYKDKPMINYYYTTTGDYVITPPFT